MSTGTFVTAQLCSDDRSLLPLVRFHQDRALPLLLLHFSRLVSVFDPDTIVKHFMACFIYLLPPVKASSLTQCSNRVGKSMMNIGEQHFVPAMFASVRDRHQIMQD